MQGLLLKGGRISRGRERRGERGQEGKEGRVASWLLGGMEALDGPYCCKRKHNE